MNNLKFRLWDKVGKEWVKAFRIGPDGSISTFGLFSPVEVTQFTGLFDRNGKEIWEGDVINGNLFDNRLPTMGEIVWDKGCACFGNKNESGITHLYKIAEIEVIGNIYTERDK